MNSVDEPAEEKTTERGSEGDVLADLPLPVDFWRSFVKRMWGFDDIRNSC